jgi:tetratricopeptide (TPR) repeat protein
MKMRKRDALKSMTAILLVLVMVNLAYAQFSTPSSGFSGGDYRVFGSSVNPQFNDPNFLTNIRYTNPGIYWSQYNSADCLQRQDFVMQIVPGGCSPAVVRSDLLEEQNVPVFCKVMATQINPLIDVSKIRSLHFKGEYPPGVSGVSYYPARAALRSSTSLEGSPIQDNLGYLVVVLSRQAVEEDMPEYVAGNITAVIDYDSEGAYGIGNTNFYVSEMSDEEWIRNYKHYSFWNGKGYIRADSIESDRATIAVYRDMDSREATVTLKKGETSHDIYLGGFYCAAGLNIRLESLDAPVPSALLQINDEQVWVAKGDRILDDKCRVTEVSTYAGGGKVSINCPIKNGKIDLTLNPGKAYFDYQDTQSREKAIGDRIDPSQKVYLGYVGLASDNEKYAVLIKDETSDTEREFADKQVYDAIEKEIAGRTLSLGELKEVIENAVEKQYSSKLRLRSSQIEQNISIGILTEGGNVFDISLDEVDIARDKDWSLRELTSQEKLAKQYYDEAIDYYEELADLYPNERPLFLEEEDSYAARGLLEAAVLSRQFEMNEKAYDFYDRLLRDHPNSNSADIARFNKDLVTRYDTRNSKAIVLANNEQYFIDLLDFRKPESDELSVVLLINGKEETLGLNEIKSIYKNDESQHIQVTKIQDEAVYIKYHKSGENVTGKEQTKRLDVDNNQVMFEDLTVKLMNINLQKQAKLRITAKDFGTRTEANFTFAIGIEKRAIKLSPEQTKEMIENLLEAIKMWEDLNNKLGKVIKGMKAACFATSAVLTAKSLLEGLSGKSMARKELMTGAGGWNEKCEQLVAEKKYRSLQECLRENGDLIEKDIDIYTQGIENTNNVLRGMQEEVGIEKTDFLDFKGHTDAKEVEERYKQYFEEECGKLSGGVTLPGKEQTSVSFGGENGICSWDSLTHEQRREILTLARIRNSGSDTLKDFADRELGKTALYAKNYEEEYGARIRAEKEAQEHKLGIRTTTPLGDAISMGDVKTITASDRDHQIYGNMNVGDSVIRIFIPFSKELPGGQFTANPEVAGKEVIVQVSPADDGEFYIPEGKIYLVDGTAVSENASNSVREYMSFSGLDKVREANAKAYENPMLHPERLSVKYFDRAPYKGLPAEVPFDIKKGWYVELTYVLTGVGKPYDESGRPVNYYICNVGPNGLIEFKKSADDICRYYNGHSSELAFPGMSNEESSKLVSAAQRAIADAANQYGKERVVINGQTFKSGVSFGGEEGRCTDFMSAEDCNILFNVCDPVICPSSRCNLGGKYEVDNVIQTGIIGSLVLCLPNFKEGVIIPICLSGVHAGLEGYISILNSTVQCLNESLETGRNVGVCDEIKSIYLCEFFWRQLAPFLEVLVPSLLESFYQQGARGGGEYLTIQSAWENTQGAINYFKNDYAVNSMQAFNARSSEEIGTEICKSFVSVNFPASASIFESLIEPDSPVQYHAWFSENSLTTATIPPTSHYKVYYHIYAGKDMGAYYAVYLKDLPQSNAIHSMQTYVVDRGYITRGNQVDEARDFTAVSGYKQLCVSVNGKEECGFGKVSTSYLVNRLSDEYAQEQLTTDITSEEECIAGTPSIYSLFQPNLQAGVQEVIEPELYNQGIVRVCATENPGKQVNPSGEYDTTNSTYDRWKMVGYCDDPTIKCWLDTNSVKEVIKDQGIEDEVLGEVDLSHLGEEEYLTDETSRSIADEAEQLIEELVIERSDDEATVANKIKDIKDMLEDLTRLSSTNVNRARGLYLLGVLYKKVAENLLPLEGGEEGEIYYGSYDSYDETTSSESLESGESEEGEFDTEEFDEITEDLSAESKVVFEFNDGRGTVSDLFYRYRGEWQWSPDGKEWISVNSVIETSEGENPAGENIIFIKKLRGKTYQEGINLLAVRTIRNDEGGWLNMQFGDTELKVTIGDKTETYAADHPLLRDTNTLIKRINNLALNL